MNHYVTSLVVLVAATISSGCGYDEKPNNGKKALSAMQGTWLVVAYGAKGDPVAPGEGETWVIKGDRLRIYSGSRRDRIKVSADLKVDPSKNPAHLDLAIKGKGNVTEHVTYAIYSLKGDGLTICIPEKFDKWEPENRPKEFKSTRPAPGKDSGFSVFVLKRKSS